MIPIKTGFSIVWRVILPLLALAGIGWAVYAGVIRPTTKPNPTETQQADNIVNHNYTLSPKQTFFGCANFRIEKEKK